MKLALALAFALAVACGSPPPVAAPTSHAALANTAASESTGSNADDVMATLDRGECYGWCPIYKVTVHRSGRVEYHGYRFVKLRGDAVGHLDASQLDALDRAFDHVDYFSLADSYTHEDVTDAPTATTSYRRRGRTKTIPHYAGDGKAPYPLTTLETEIDRIVNIDQWIGTDDERAKLRDQWMKEMEAEAGSGSN